MDVQDVAPPGQKDCRVGRRQRHAADRSEGSGPPHRDIAHTTGSGAVGRHDRDLMTALGSAIGQVADHCLDTTEVGPVGLVRVNDSDEGSVDRGLAGTVVLVDCRWIGASGIGRSTELLLRALAIEPPAGTWVLWARQPLGELAWPGAQVVLDPRPPRAWLGQRAVLRRPRHDVAIYPAQIRPAGRRPSIQLLYDATPIVTDRQVLSRTAKRLYYRALGRSTSLLVCSDAAADELVSRVGIDRSKVTIYGFPVDEASARRVFALRASTGTRPEVLFVGRAAPHKNLDRLVAAHARSRWSEVGSLVLVGPGTEALDQPQRRVIGLGRVPDAELEQRMARARAVVLPSLSEGFGLPVLEAQAAGLPVLASDISPLREALDEDWDVAFEPTDVGSIAAALDLVAAERVPKPGERPHPGATLAAHRDLILGVLASTTASAGQSARSSRSALARRRREIFARPYPLDQEILTATATEPGHAFLTNPTSHVIYRYLTQYVAEVARTELGPGTDPVRVLDWGSGKGQVSFLLEKLGLQCTRADVVAGGEDSSFGQPTPLLDGQLVVPLEHPWKLPFDSGAFDVALSVGVLEHVPDDRSSLRELHRVLRPGGLLFVFDLPASTSWTQRASHLRGCRYHDRLYGMRATRRMVREPGFLVLDSWRRQLLPKNTVRWPLPRHVERIDQALTDWTPLGLLATSIELVARRL